MIQDTIRQIEESLRRDGGAPERREELLRLVAALRTELESLEGTHAERARQIARLTEAAHDASRGGSDREQQRDAADRLAESAGEFEATHPRLTSVVQALANALASAGL